MAELLTFDFSELEDFARHLREDHAKAARAMPIVAEAMVTAVQEVFEQEGAVGPHPLWPGLKDSTKRQRRGTEPFWILRDTGTMAASIEPEAGDTYAQAFTDSPYFTYHRTGTSRMAKRDPYQIDEDAFLLEAYDVFWSFFRRRH